MRPCWRKSSGPAQTNLGDYKMAVEALEPLSRDVLPEVLGKAGVVGKTAAKKGSRSRSRRSRGAAGADGVSRSSSRPCARCTRRSGPTGRRRAGSRP